MLINDFAILQSYHDGDEIKARIQFESSHPIFEGHFPEQPIVPGVCMLQLIKEVLEKAEERELTLENATNIKFISLIDPNQFPAVELSIKIVSQEDGLKIRASLFEKNQIFFKFNGRFH